MKIEDIKIRQIFDSRGDATLEAIVFSDDGRRYTAAAPGGKSRGKEEAVVFDFGQARKSIVVIHKAVVGSSFASIRAFDEVLLSLDSTSRKEKLGGNVTLVLSMALTRALASEKGMEAWQLIRGEFFPHVEDNHPFILANAINGGAHATNTLDIQEYSIVAQTKSSFTALVAELSIMYRALGDKLRAQYNISNLAIGDEGGYSLNLDNNFTPIALLDELIENNKSQHGFLIGLDVAASSFFERGEYKFDGKELNTKELAEVYADYFERAPKLKFIEDPFEETDGEGFALLTKQFPERVIIADDLVVTNAKKIEHFGASGQIGATIIKLNQVGTVTEACEAIEVARKYKLQVIVSHRSGETNDAFLVHLGKAASTDGFKIGVPVHERLDKLNEVIRLYDTDLLA